MDILTSFLYLIFQVVSSCFDILNRDYLHCGFTILQLFLSFVLITAFVKFILSIFGYSSFKLDLVIPSNFKDNNSISNSDRESQIVNYDDLYW